MIKRLYSPIFVSALLAGGILPAAEPAQARKGVDPAADALLNFSVTVRPRTYLSLHDGKVYAEKDAGARKADLDFVYLAVRDGGYIKREFYNLSGKDTQLPAELLGTKAGIVALSWSDDLVAKCKTTADLKRMTGSYTANSFSFYAVVNNNRTGDLENKRFIFLDARGRMGLFTVKQGANDDLVLDGKITP